MSHIVPLPKSVTLEAADWMLRMRDEEAACFLELTEWLKGSPQHLQAYVAVNVVWKITGRKSFLSRFNVDKMLEDHRREQAAERRSMAGIRFGSIVLRSPLQRRDGRPILVWPLSIIRRT